MPTIYRIIFNNASGVRGNYAVFSEPPAVSTTNQVYTNAWISRPVNAGGNFTISTSLDFYAWVGTTIETPGPGVSISGGTAQIAELGTTANPGSSFTMVVENNYPDLTTPIMASKSGSFEIDTGTDFSMPNKTYMIGMGKVDSFGIVSPVATAMAQANMNTSITPIMKFYLGQFNYQPGEIVNFNSISNKCGVIDFSSGEGLGKFTAIVTQDNTGKFTTRYSAAVGTAEVLLAIKEKRLQSYLFPDSPGGQSDQQRELQQIINRLTAILKGIPDSGSGGIGNYLYEGLVYWPARAPVATALAGAGLIVAYLISQGWEPEISYEVQPNGTFALRVRLRRPTSSNALGGSTPEDDWAKALDADTQDDGHWDGGLSPINNVNSLLQSLIKQQESISAPPKQKMTANGVRKQIAV